MAVDLITLGKLGYVSQDRCLGVYVLDEAAGEVLTLRTRPADPRHRRLRQGLSLHHQSGHRHR